MGRYPRDTARREHLPAPDHRQARRHRSMPLDLDRPEEIARQVLRIGKQLARAPYGADRQAMRERKATQLVPGQAQEAQERS